MAGSCVLKFTAIALDVAPLPTAHPLHPLREREPAIVPREWDGA